MELIKNDMLCQQVTKFIQDHINAEFLTDALKHQMAEAYKNLSRENAAVTLEFVSTIYSRASQEAKVLSDANLMKNSGMMIAIGLGIGIPAVLVLKHIENRKKNAYATAELCGWISSLGGSLSVFGMFGGVVALMSMADLQF
jgi:hypothetical protein